MLKDFTIPGANRVTLSSSLASELKLHKQKSRDHMFELYFENGSAKVSHGSGVIISLRAT